MKRVFKLGSGLRNLKSKEIFKVAFAPCLKKSFAQFYCEKGAIKLA